MINKFNLTKPIKIPKEWNNNELNVYLDYIYACLNDLYKNEHDLFGKNLCERCITFRFAHLLQNLLDKENDSTQYFVDCDYNSSFYYDPKRNEWIQRNGKPIRDSNGELTKRFIDIIVHQRQYGQDSDIFCFEIKKWDNCTKSSVVKDLNNLRQLTLTYGYSYGFHLIFGREFKKTKLSVIKEEKKISYSLL